MGKRDQGRPKLRRNGMTTEDHGEKEWIIGDEERWRIKENVDPHILNVGKCKVEVNEVLVS